MSEDIETVECFGCGDEVTILDAAFEPALNVHWCGHGCRRVNGFQVLRKRIAELETERNVHRHNAYEAAAAAGCAPHDVAKVVTSLLEALRRVESYGKAVGIALLTDGDRHILRQAEERELGGE